MKFAGRCTPFVNGDGFAIQCRDQHYRIRESDAMRLLRGGEVMKRLPEKAAEVEL